jgi:hypothetical protein
MVVASMIALNRQRSLRSRRLVRAGEERASSATQATDNGKILAK